MFQQVGILFNTCDKIDFKLSMKSNFTGSSKASIWPLLALLPISSDYRHLKFLPDIIFDKINGILGQINRVGVLSNDDLNESKLQYNGLKSILKEHSYFYAYALFMDSNMQVETIHVMKINTCKFSFRLDFTPLQSIQPAIQRRNYVQKEHPLSTF